MKPAFQPYEGPEPYIFVRYAPEDMAQVISFLNALNAAGYRVWYDKAQAGSRYDDVVAAHIIRCAVFLLLLSRASVRSDDCYEQTMYARHKGRTIVPVYLDDAELPPGLEMRLLSIQYMRLSDYDGMEHFALALRNEDAFAPCEISRRRAHDERTEEFA